MTVILAKEVYPLRCAKIAEAEFEPKLNVNIKDFDELTYIIKFGGILQGMSLPHSVSLFLNRVLEIAVLEKFA